MFLLIVPLVGSSNVVFLLIVPLVVVSNLNDHDFTSPKLRFLEVVLRIRLHQSTFSFVPSYRGPLQPFWRMSNHCEWKWEN